MASTEDGLPLFRAGGGDLGLMRQRIEEARQLADIDDRAVRLYLLGRGLLDCDDPTTGAEAVTVLAEAMQAGSAHAAMDLGQILLGEATSSTEVQAALALIERAAKGELVEAQVLLGKILMENPATEQLGREWLHRAEQQGP